MPMQGYSTGKRSEMIEKALKFTSDTLDQFLKNRFGLDESKVILNRLIESDGTIPAVNQNKVIISLINVERETNKAFNVRNHQLPDGSYVNVSQAEKFTLDMLVSSSFSDYSESLRFLNEIILFFQVNTWLSASSSSAIPKGINKLEYDLEKLNFQQVHSLWTGIGAKYLPSVLYKMRLLTIQGDEAEGFTAAIAAISNQVNQ